MVAVREASGRHVPPLLIWAGVLCVLLIGLLVGVSSALPQPEQRTAFSDLVSPAVELIATAALSAAAWKTAAQSRRLAFAWGTIALAMLFYTIGDIVWAILELGLQEPPFPSLADVFYLLYYPAFLAGAVQLLKKPTSWRPIADNALDLGIILTGAFLGFQNFLIGPIITSSAGSSALEQFILVAYPVGDLVLLGALFLLAYGDYSRPPGRDIEQLPAPVLVLAAGMTFMIVSDCIYSYQSLLGLYVSGSLLDYGFLTAILLTGLAGIYQWISLGPGNVVSNFRPGPGFRAVATQIKWHLPYVWLAGAFALLIASAVAPMPMSFLEVVLGIGVMLALVMARQYIALADNLRLNRQLNGQAAQLASANQELNLEIQERLRIEEKLAFDVLHDQLTGLANRRLFLDRLGQALKRSRRHPQVTLGVLFMDLDQFKVINDSLGHSMGDQLLISVGKRLIETLRANDTVARFGGDEFAVLLDDLDDQDTARLLADRVLEALCKPFVLGDREVHVSASIGITTDANKYEYADDLLRDVDLAMYKAKALGKSRCVLFETAMRDQAYTRLAMEEGLRQALRNQEFRLFYQPITSLESDQVVGMEALLRWQHPAKGLLLPAEFLEVAEESNLILPMGEWVLNEACWQLRAWHDQYPHLPHLTINVNLSNHEFSQPDLAEKVAQALHASALHGAYLRLEITERVLVENYPTANDTIAALNAMGVHVHIDDFGTGYSALAYLQEFPINAIKIDKSFIGEMGRNRKGLALVRAIVSMARELGMETIAEGIETGEQLNELKGLLCGFGQGFLLSHPLDADAAGKVLDAIRIRPAAVRESPRST